MSLSDLVEVARTVRMERRPLSRTEIHRRWVQRNRNKWNAYRRKWRQKRREQGLPVT